MKGWGTLRHLRRHSLECGQGVWQEMVAGLLGYFGTRYDLLAGDPRH